MSLAKEKDLFKKRTYLFYLPARPATSPLAIDCSRKTTRHFLQALISFCAGKAVFFRVRPGQ